MTTSTPAEAADRLHADFDGEVIRPHDAGYDSARTVFPGGFDRKPAAIVRPQSATEVSRVITLARDMGAGLSVRSGGHSGAAHGVVDDAIVIDLAEMRALDIDPESRTAWAQTGMTAGEYTAAAGEHRLATGFGDTASVGIGGITLGGGVGFLSRKYGLTIDELLAAEIVTADGEILEIDEESHPALFWAIRGGGGNFGVVTRFKFRLREVPEAYGGMLMLPADPDVLHGAMAAALEAPEELSGMLNVMPAPPMPFVPAELHGQLVVMGLLCFVGSAEEGERAFEPIRSLATPVADMVRPIAYPEMYGPEPEDYHPDAIVRTGYMDSFDRDAAEAVLEQLRASDASMRVTQLRPLGGAISKVPADATAYAHRDAAIMVNVAAFVDEPAQRDERLAWVTDLYGRITPADGPAYVNFLTDEGPERVRAAYPGDTFERLARVKAEYDPDNLFRNNQNVPPSS
jgi:FAD/FMN-containing dehydrogenase